MHWGKGGECQNEAWVLKKKVSTKSDAVRVAVFIRHLNSEKKNGVCMNDE